MEKPGAAFRMHRLFKNGAALDGFDVDTDDQMAIDRQAIVVLELGIGQVPMRE